LTRWGVVGCANSDVKCTPDSTAEIDEEILIPKIIQKLRDGSSLTKDILISLSNIKNT
jgi:hypothetical protein